MYEYIFLHTDLMHWDSKSDPAEKYPPLLPNRLNHRSFMHPFLLLKAAPVCGLPVLSNTQSAAGGVDFLVLNKLL